jgi:heptosyltransferase-3
MVPDAVDLAAISRALVMKLRHHGDVLLSSPVFSVLKRHAPHIEIDALVYDDTREMLTLHPAIAMVHTVGRAWRKQPLPRKLAAEWRLLRALRERRYDLIITLTEHPRGVSLARLLRPTYAVGPEQRDRGRLWSRSFTHLYRLPMHGKRHMVEVNLDALRRMGIYPSEDERQLVLVPGDEAEASIASQLSALGVADGKFIHVHPASRWRFKCWPAERTAELIDALAPNYPIVITAAPSDPELALVRAIQAVCRSPLVNLAGKLSLKELAALTQRARLFVGVDSAPMHIAAAMGTPTVALFGPSGENEWRPWQVPHRVVTSDMHPCRPCGNDGCGGGKVSECLTTLRVARVLSAARELLAMQR